MKLNLSIDLAVVISIITVFLFANGNAYLGGYLHTFNVSPIALNFSVQDKIYIGYIHGFNYLIYLVLALTLFIILKHTSLSLGIPAAVSKYFDKKLNKPKDKHQVNIHNSTFYEELNESYAKNSFLVVLTLVFLITTLLLIANTEKDAKSLAKYELINHKLDKIQLKTTKNETIHYLVQCGSNLCAVISTDNNVTLEDTKNIIFFPSTTDDKKAP